MRKLYSPWRSKYIETYDKIEGCFLCDAYKSNNDEEKLVLYRGKKAFVIMNLFPYNAGHVMVCPNEHIGDFTELDKETLFEISVLSQMMVEAIKLALNPDGFNMGYNLGRVSGAGLESHIHNHIVPRWNGDTNFMPTIAEVKVISQDLKDIYIKIKNAIEKVKDRYVK
ncbi:MAG: HIT family hydrolase [Persephonella sp.]|nr:MAG: HIT family hydrolase [Persephonella sp.]